MRFTSRTCYQLRGSLLHCLFTLTRFAAGGTISVALSVTHWALQKTAAARLCPVITRHSFRRSPDFLSLAPVIISRRQSGYIPSVFKNSLILKITLLPLPHHLSLRQSLRLHHLNLQTHLRRFRPHHQTLILSLRPHPH